MTRTIRAAALQLQATDRDAFADAWPTHRAAIEHAAEASDLLVLPEASIPAYVLRDDRIDDGAVERAISEVCVIAQRHGTVIVTGVAARSGTVLRNRALVIERDGSIAGHADKLFLWHFDRRWFEAGDSIEPVATSLGSLGVLVCADGRLPEIAAALIDRGAEILVMPTAWVSTGRNPADLENAQADLLASVRAYENGVPFVAANKCGTELGMVAYCGKSQIIDATGETLALASQNGMETIAHTLSIGAPAPKRTPLTTRPIPKLQAQSRSARVAISMDAPSADTASRLAIIDAEHLIGPGRPDANASDTLSSSVPLARLWGTAPYDPTLLARYRRSGYRAVVWQVAQTSPWVERIARARALELRIYVIVLDEEADRAFAIDPDGAVIAGTFGSYRIASLLLDLARTEQTTLAPGTDIDRGFERVNHILANAR